MYQFPEETKGLDLRSSQRGASENADSAVQPCDRRSVAYRMDDKLDIGKITRIFFPEGSLVEVKTS